MDPAQFFAASRLVIVAGKGGVGETTVSAALARAAARSGLSALIVEVEGKSGLANLFGREPLTYDEVTLSQGGGPEGASDIRGRMLTPDDALLEYLRDHGMSRISKRLVSSGALDVVATAAPGIKDILILGKVKQLERTGKADLLILDAPAAGHAITFLLSARRAARRGSGRPDQQPGAGRARHADRPRAMPGDARDAPGGDAGQRARRHRLPPRRSRRRGPRSRGRQRPVSGDPRSRRRSRGRGGACG